MGTPSVQGKGNNPESLTQFAEQITTQLSVQSYRESQYGGLPYWGNIEDENSDYPSANISQSEGETELVMPNGASASDVRKLQVRENLQYISSRVAKWTGYVRVPESDKLTDAQTLETGPSTDNNGLPFRVSAGSSELDCLIKKAGSTRVVNDINDTDAIWSDRKKVPVNLIRNGTILGVLYAWYGAGPFVMWFALRPGTIKRFPTSTREIFQIYSPQDDSNLTGKYMETPNLPTRYKLSNNGTSPSAKTTFYVGGSQIGRYGDTDPHQRKVTEEVQDHTVSAGSLDPVISIRPKEQFKGRENDANIRIVNVDIDNTGNNPVRIKAQIDGDASGNFDDAEYEDAPAKFEAAFEVESSSPSATYLTGAPVSPKLYIRSGQGNSKGESEDSEILFILGEGETYTIFAEGVDGNSEIQVYVDVVQSV